jgi:hypothetical protein
VRLTLIEFFAKLFSGWMEFEFNACKFIESTASSSSNSDTKSVQLSTIEVTKTQSIFACNGVELISTPNCDTTIQCRLAKRCLNGVCEFLRKFYSISFIHVQV